jgi:hypothetical protein
MIQISIRPAVIDRDDFQRIGVELNKKIEQVVEKNVRDIEGSRVRGRRVSRS